MFTDRIFRVAFLVSIFVHGALLYPAPGFQSRRQLEKELERELARLEVIYYEIKENPPPEQEIARVTPQPARFPAEAVEETVEATREGDIPVEPEPKVKVTTSEPEGLESSTLYAMAPEFKDLPHEQKPLFLDYYRAIREQIKHSTTYPLGASRNLVEGSTLLSFVLGHDGSLKEVRVRKSSGNTLLDQSAYQSLESASPFPPFPLRLKQSHLRLSIQISYELD